MKKYLVLSILALVLVLLLVTSAVSGMGSLNLPWWTVDDGGGTSTSEYYTLSGSIGQPDAGVLAGGSYTLGGGYWPGSVRDTAGNDIYLPLVWR